ncbi:YqfO family protein [Thiomicrorhabdus sp. zzn3]|uniref:YqfO family protein n=1 Tax=Thiomicrorhabdus sp. zzn3 TaxID=3039775 RepID=UPI0024371AE6|nr:YqfO family protein [Thiomicrorhabdus sp. zzn3]MDG6777666.1 YqfO family protein [Thiomicrorhabdus sp. zzn3]
MFKLNVFIPETHLEVVKQALFDAGAGKIGNYDACSWQVKGEGQFRPLEGSQPFIGHQHQIETVTEYKVEMVCDATRIAEVIRALIQAHPYEEPAYEVYQLVDVNALSMTS